MLSPPSLMFSFDLFLPAPAWPLSLSPVYTHLLSPSQTALVARCVADQSEGMICILSFSPSLHLEEVIERCCTADEKTRVDSHEPDKTEPGEGWPTRLLNWQI